MRSIWRRRAGVAIRIAIGPMTCCGRNAYSKSPSIRSRPIRHGTMPVRWRTDKALRQCTVEQLDVAVSVLGLLEG